MEKIIKLQDTSFVIPNIVSWRLWEEKWFNEKNHFFITINSNMNIRYSIKTDRDEDFQKLETAIKDYYGEQFDK
jgi:hypothetical protein